MTFGTCCISRNNDLFKLKPKYVKIEGVQKGFIVNFEMIQAFRINSPESQEISYIFPNDLKMCIYDTTFMIGDTIIKPQLAPFDEAKTIYDDAIGQGQIVVYGAQVGKGLIELKIGNLPPRTTCKVILKIAFECQEINQNTLMIKFPLSIYTPIGEIDCLNIKSNFSFNLHVDPNEIASVKSNVINGIYVSHKNTFNISKEIKNHLTENSIILAFVKKEKMRSSALLSSSKNNTHDFCALSLSFDENANIEPNTNESKEFIFVVDCSGSMSYNPIKNAAECLEIFIKSLPTNSFFNIIRFGSSYEKLFDYSVQYNEDTAEKALRYVQNMDADLGGTELYNPISDIFKNKAKYGKREVFILTDGQVSDMEKIINLVAQNSNQNRCNTIGFGSGCDGGLVEGIANASGGKCDFVQYNDSLSEKVIPQLQSSLLPYIENVEIHLQGDDNNSFEISPFPLPNLSYNNSSLCYLRCKKDTKDKQIQNPFSKGILISGLCKGHQTDFIVDKIEQIDEYPDNYKYGISKELNIGKAISSLFAYKLLKKYELNDSLDQQQKEAVIKLSLSSGILCKYTGFIGMIKPDNEAIQKARKTIICRGICFGQAPKMLVDYFWKDRQCSSDDELSDNNDEIEINNSEDFSNNEKTVNSFDVVSLIRLQHIDGYWENLDDVNQICSLNIHHINEIKIENKDIERKCIATITAIVALHVKTPEKQNTWNMIEQKAKHWLKQNLKNINIDQLLRKIEQSL